MAEIRSRSFSRAARNKLRRVLLVHPPYGDFTYPYHSLSYVATPLKAAGYEVDVIDLNAHWFRSVFSSDCISGWRNEMLAEFNALESRPNLDIKAQKRIAQLLHSIATCNWLEPEKVVRTFRSESFYDQKQYLWARSQVRSFEQLLSFRYKSYDFFTAFAVPPYEPAAEVLIERAESLGRLVDDAIRLLRTHCGEDDYLFCGISFPFSTQLAPGMAVFAALAELYPDAYRVAGGTAITDVYKYRSDSDALIPFSQLCDFFYVGEAETGVVDFADWCRGLTDQQPSQIIPLDNPKAARLISLPYVSLSHGHRNGFHYFDWAKCPPDYSWVDWSLYLAPEKRVNYSPSRGCFWNRCTFCDYGLNGDGPTAPSRTMEAEVVVNHLRELATQGIEHVYLAVDAISPKFLDSFAGVLLDEGLKIHWSSQFFLTRQFTGEFVGRLAESGLRVASFGLESGSSRVLEWMGKGHRRVEEILKPAFEAFRDSPIALQPLFYFGFPGETGDDRQQTVDLLLEYSDIFSNISKGGVFDLLPGSIIAKDPARFGVQNIKRRPDDNIAGALEYQLVPGEPPLACDAFRRFNDQLPHWNVFERPWAGGIDTLHTQLYLHRFGRNALSRLREEFKHESEPWGEVQVSACFDLREILDNVVISEGLQRLEQNELKCAIPPDLIELASAQLSVPVVRRAHTKQHELSFRQYREV